MMIISLLLLFTVVMELLIKMVIMTSVVMRALSCAAAGLHGTDNFIVADVVKKKSNGSSKTLFATTEV